jgi:MFS family permease
MPLAGENLLELLVEILSQIASDIMRLTPKILIALVVFALTLLVIKVLNFSLRKLLKLAKLNAILKQLSGYSLPFSMDNLIIFFADLGVFLIFLYALVNLFLGPQYLHLMTEGLQYSARIVSIIAIAIILFAIFNTVISRVKVETRLRSYALFIVLLMITAMLIDITALSDPIKNALTNGLAIGVGISIGVFAVWFFFHDYLDEMFKAKTASTRSNTQPK